MPRVGHSSALSTRDSKRNEIGFVRASKLRERDRYMLVED
jgi:hypothetical protein